MTARADGRVIGVAVDDEGNATLIDDGKVITEGVSRDEAMAGARMQGGRQSLSRASAEALMSGNQKRAQALQASAVLRPPAGAKGAPQELPAVGGRGRVPPGTVAGNAADDSLSGGTHDAPAGPRNRTPRRSPRCASA